MFMEAPMKVTYLDDRFDDILTGQKYVYEAMNKMRMYNEGLKNLITKEPHYEWARGGAEPYASALRSTWPNQQRVFDDVRSATKRAVELVSSYTNPTENTDASLKM